MGTSGIFIERYTDGANEHVGKADVEIAMKQVWDLHYSSVFGELQFSPNHDLKQHRSGHASLDFAAAIRNPDIFYWLRDQGPLGGIEVTTHSPDGSNIEKRYPFLWASRVHGLSAFVATPYLKIRPGGSINRLPHRHSEHNLLLLGGWIASDPKSDLQQLLPVADLMFGDSKAVPPDLLRELWSWTTIGTWFAHKAALTMSAGKNLIAVRELESLKHSLQRLATACIANAGHQKASTLHVEGDRWIQTYNARPETGWWERGEGQLDSIDGRVMFALDTIGLLPPSARPNKFEFWMPLMTRKHPWIQEQIARSYGSKRLRNLAVVLPTAKLDVSYQMKYADQLTDDDWQILRDNPSLVLERLVGPPAEYNLSTLVPEAEYIEFGQSAAKQRDLALQIANLVSDTTVWVSTTRPYCNHWQRQLHQRVLSRAIQGNLYLPRVPGNTIHNWPTISGLTIHAAEACSKELLFALREFHKTKIIR